MINIFLFFLLCFVFEINTFTYFYCDVTEIKYVDIIDFSCNCYTDNEITDVKTYPSFSTPIYGNTILCEFKTIYFYEESN